MSGKKQPSRMLYYSLDAILQRQAQYNIIFGERSNGKTYAVLKYGVEKYIKTGKQMAILRRFIEDIRGKRGDVLFNALSANGEIERMTKGRYKFIKHINRRFYLAYHDDELNKDICDNVPLAYSFALNEMEHDKSTSYPDITTIMFDEFLTRQVYLKDEFVTFMNVISTIVRNRDDVTIFMLGNTVNKYCPYFEEMGLRHIQQMKQGTIDLYEYGENKLLRVAVEYCQSMSKSKPSNVYFGFDNPKLQMIKGGVWEMAMYPHCPVKYTPNQIILTYFIVFDNNILQCEVVDTGKETFTFIHRKTTPIYDDDNDIIYSMDYSPKPNHVRRLSRPANKWQRKIAEYFALEKVFYQDNEVGEIVRNFVIQSSGDLLKYK